MMNHDGRFSTRMQVRQRTSLSALKLKAQLIFAITAMLSGMNGLTGKKKHNQKPFNGTDLCDCCDDSQSTSQKAKGTFDLVKTHLQAIL